MFRCHGNRPTSSGKDQTEPGDGPDTPTISWFGVPTLYRFGAKVDGTNLFEERIVVFSATTPQEALSKTEWEADEYAAFNSLQRHAWVEAYEQDGDSLIDGDEVWSDLFAAAMDLETFVRSRDDEYRYRPD